MANSFVASRAQLVYALCLPLAVLLGYFLADPMDSGSILAVSLVIGFLSIPLLMNWYHPLLLLTWNAAIAPVILPGGAYLWTALAFIGIFFALINRFISAEARFESVPQISRSLLFLLLVVIVTAWLRGGVPLRSFGAAHYGGRNYFLIAAAICGYFALTSRRVPIQKATIYSEAYFLSGVTALIPNLAFFIGPAAYFLFYLFPSGLAEEQAVGAMAVNDYITRLIGLTFASAAFYCWLFVRYGVRGLLDMARPWRMGFFLVACVACLLTGFRSHMILFLLTMAAQAYFEKLLKPRVLVSAMAIVVVLCAIILPNAGRLPVLVQRTISFIPGISLNPAVMASAEGSSEWRLRMWEALVPQIPKYLLEGKGYIFDPGEQILAGEQARRNPNEDYAGALYSGDYHNGPLTLIIPLGIWGLIGFLWFLVASWRFLYRNYRHGPPELFRINTFLISFFTARIVYFFLVFGMFPSDIFTFTGVVGLSVCLNGTELIEPEESTAEHTEVTDHEELELTLRRTQAP